MCLPETARKRTQATYNIIMCCSAMCVYTLADSATGRPRQIFWQFLPPQTKIKTFFFLSSQVNSFHTLQSLSSWRRYPADPFSPPSTSTTRTDTNILSEIQHGSLQARMTRTQYTTMCDMKDSMQTTSYIIYTFVYFINIIYNIIISYNRCNDENKPAPAAYTYIANVTFSLSSVAVPLFPALSPHISQ